MRNVLVLKKTLNIKLLVILGEVELGNYYNEWFGIYVF